MGTLQSTREPIAVTPQTNWGPPYRRRLSSLCPVSNIHLCCERERLCEVPCYSSFRVMQGQQLCVTTAPLHCELFIVLDVGRESLRLLSAPPLAESHLQLYWIKHRMQSSLSIISFATFFILYPSTAHQFSEKVHSDFD